MPATCSEEPTQRHQTTAAPLIDVLHTVTILYELLPPSSRQVLSASCCCLHRYIRGHVSCVRIRHSHELPGLAPQTWPNLVGILLHDPGMSWYIDSKSLLQGKWQLDAQVCFTRVSRTHAAQANGETEEQSWSRVHHEFVMLVSPVGSRQHTDL